ncbi:BTAD domain-containing putative transcriptional regulator [Nocardioides sp. AE5]|uniref:BTAD domain-containing putative transcriptional regulator n=1 Tax=Nocardioides sp. AE5 TaxID=2962573 RepID=UPI002880D223|nr:BTAD domain-containing putative transcriptional regulator [Nocardioides sp. AE5]MDT0202993.1 BTAD domain-containing putative transcriptional regulator [Nocardioides sp. AE5]
MRWRLDVFGETRLLDNDGTQVALTRTQQRLLARLALADGAPSSLTSLIDALWEQEPPASARAAVQNQVSRLRAVADTSLIDTQPEGYVLGARSNVADFLADVAQAEEALLAGDIAAAFDAAERAVDTRGRVPYASLGEQRAALSARALVSQAVRVAEDVRFDAALGLGRLGWALVEAQRLAGATPHDSGRAVRLARALDAHGRRGDALAALSDFRRRVRSDLGIEAGAEIETEQTRLLRSSGPHDANSRRPFVGREDTVEHLVASARRGGLAWLHGEPGVGISRCMDRVRARLIAEGFSVGSTRCPAHAGPPGSPLLDLIDDLGVEADHDRGVLGAFLEAVRHRAMHRPVALLVDDWQHTGPSTRSALRSAADLPRVTVVLGAHGAPDPAEGGTVVELTGLDPESVARMVAADPAVDPGVDPLELHRLSGGNPLLVEVLLHADRDAAGAGPGLTPVLDQVFAARISDLSRPERQLLEIAAIAGDGAPVALVDAVWRGEGPTQWPAGLVEEHEGLVRFRHPALRTAAYRQVDAGRRSEIHHALGSAAERHRAPTATVAAHLVEAADLDPVAAYDAVMRAGEDATVAGLHQDAAAWFHRAQDLVRHGTHPERDRWLARIAEGDALRLSGDPRHVDLLLEAAQAAIALGETDLLARAAYALLQLGATSDVADPPARVRTVIDAALEIADDEVSAPLRAAASLTWSLSGNAATSRELFVAAERAAVTDEARRRTLPFAYMALGLPGDLAEREQIGRELLGLGRDAADPVASFEAHHLLFSAGLQRGDGRGVRRSLAAMNDLVDRVGDVGRRWQLLYQRATIAHLQGDDAAAEKLSEDALTMFQVVSPNRALAAYFGQVFAIRMTQGRTGELSEVLRGLVDEQPGIPAWHAALALSLASTGSAEDRPAAVEHVHQARELAEADLTWLACHLVAGRAAAGVGDRALSRLLVADLTEWSGRGCWQGTCSYGPVDTVLAMLHATLGDTAAARQHRAAAKAFAQSLGAPVFLMDLENSLPEDC